jgi:hypothetical protein
VDGRPPGSLAQVFPSKAGPRASGYTATLKIGASGLYVARVGEGDKAGGPLEPESPRKPAEESRLTHKKNDARPARCGVCRICRAGPL